MVAVPFHALGLSFDIMSLVGLAIAIGALVDAAIVVVEQTHKKLEVAHASGGRFDTNAVIVDAVAAAATGGRDSRSTARGRARARQSRPGRHGNRDGAA